MSQAQLAELADLSPNYLGMVERGEKLPTLHTLLVLAQRLDVAPADLLGDAKRDPWLDELIDVGATVPQHARSLALSVLRTIVAESAPGRAPDQLARARRARRRTTRT